MKDKAILRQETGYDNAVELLRQCSSEHGFLASTAQKDNYKRIWARDGAIAVLAALMTEDNELISCAGRTLSTLAHFQGPHGEIPSNIDPFTKQISYGGTTGRVDSNLWFIIAGAEYWRTTGNDKFIDLMTDSFSKITYLLGAWEYNNRGLLYVPLTGDWADEYLHNGYVLYDQLLYLQALRSLSAVYEGRRSEETRKLKEKATRLRHLIRTNYWLRKDEEPDGDVYHEILYKKSQKAACYCQDKYWMPFFNPSGYGYRFDCFANVLASLLKVADPAQQKAVNRHIEEIIADNEIKLLPAFDPVVTPKDEDWSDLHQTFSYTFKNKPYEFQNGGLWPLITGFYVADLCQQGLKQKAQDYLQAIHQANALPMNGESIETWSFPEYVHGRKFQAGGNHSMTWSAGAAIIGAQSLQGKQFFKLLPSSQPEPPR